MLIGVPKEIKNHEYRVGVTPAGVEELIHHGHAVLVQDQAGAAIGYDNDQYTAVGATIAKNAEEVYEKAEMIVKVKEPQPNECKMLRKGQVIFCYLHLAPDPKQTDLLQESGCTAIAFETVTANDGTLPLLSPMSEVAGRMAVQAGAHALEIAQGGRGVLLPGVTGVPQGKVTIIGGGVVGINAAKVAAGMGAKVTVLDRSISRLAYLDDVFGSSITTMYSNHQSLEKAVLEADMVIGAVLVPGASAPKLVSKALLKQMERGAVLVDVAIDQGGCFETSKPTTHQDPIYEVDGIVHYCVANIPGAVARTSTQALENATLRYTVQLANKGYRQALTEDAHFRNGLNVHEGQVTYQAVAEALNKPYVSAETVLGMQSAAA
jgi:alanine dehydrogenase